MLREDLLKGKLQMRYSTENYHRNDRTELTSISYMKKMSGLLFSPNSRSNKKTLV